jgi:hypothetical protein
MIDCAYVCVCMYARVQMRKNKPNKQTNKRKNETAPDENLGVDPLRHSVFAHELKARELILTTVNASVPWNFRAFFFLV